MRYSQYKFNFYLNASHAIYIEGKLGEAHPHTWELVVNAIKSQNEFVMFNEVESAIEKFLDRYQNNFINEFEPFDTLNPILENITRYFMEELQKLLDPLGWIIFSLEVSETPTRSYIISTVENNRISELQQQNVAKDIIENAFSE